ncbi:MAG TPA: TylF/MycF/NovP-related O-methyltransferase, partial [Anaerolineales bacterium]|nr:TylF/MycF/NovP-related O-methyltransferase [Anaerolineales bacterium]
MPPDYLREVDLDTLIITFDKEKEVALELFSSDDTRIPLLVFAGNANYEFTDPVFERIVSSCPVKSKAGGYPNMLIHLYQCLKHISERRIPGDVAEFGVFQGGTTVFMAKVLKHFSNDCRVYG